VSNCVSAVLPSALLCAKAIHLVFLIPLNKYSLLIPLSCSFSLYSSLLHHVKYDSISVAMPYYTTYLYSVQWCILVLVLPVFSSILVYFILLLV
jgi:hypothetical protein